jgi:hypothetical protein
MVSHCSNPKCNKPLHYLREGKIFVFDATENNPLDSGTGPSHRLEHFWLCGSCSKSMFLEQTCDRHVRVASKPITSLAS